MRTVKFRAWNGKEMKAVDQISFWDEGIEIATDYNNGYYTNPRMFELMQFTGLKDKNGKEIYEGDIVKWGNHCDWCKENPIRIAEVKLNPDILFASQVGDFHYGNFAYKDTDKHLEVIGNIYENGDLLK